MNLLHYILPISLLLLLTPVSIDTPDIHSLEQYSIPRTESSTILLGEKEVEIKNSVYIENSDGFYCETEDEFWVLDCYEKNVVHCFEGNTTVIPVNETALPSDVLVDEQYIYIYDDLLESLVVFTKKGDIVHHISIPLTEKETVSSLTQDVYGILVKTFQSNAYYIQKDTWDIQMSSSHSITKEIENFEYCSLYYVDQYGSEYWICSNLLKDTSILSGEVSILRTDNEGNYTGWYTLPSLEITGLSDTFVQILPDGTTYILFKTSDSYSIREVVYCSDYYSYESEIREYITEKEDNYHARAKKSSKINPAHSQTKTEDLAFEIINYTYSLKDTNVKNKSGCELPKEYVYYSENFDLPIEVTGIPYCWGGFNSLYEATSDYGTFQDNIKKGYMSGNTETSGSLKGGTCGLDCPGYVGAVYGVSSKKNTNMLLGVGVSETDITELEPMSILLSPGSHVILFHEYNDDFCITTSEAAVREGKTVVKTRSITQLMVLNCYQMRNPW